MTDRELTYWSCWESFVRSVSTYNAICQLDSNRIPVSSASRRPSIVKRSDYIALRCLVYHCVRTHLRQLNARRNFAICAERCVLGTQFSAVSKVPLEVRGENKLTLTCKLDFVSRYDGKRCTKYWPFFSFSFDAIVFVLIKQFQFYVWDDGSHSQKVRLSWRLIPWVNKVSAYLAHKGCYFVSPGAN